MDEGHCGLPVERLVSLAADLLARGAEIEQQAIPLESEIMAVVNSKI